MLRELLTSGRTAPSSMMAHHVTILGRFTRPSRRPSTFPVAQPAIIHYLTDRLRHLQDTRCVQTPRQWQKKSRCVQTLRLENSEAAPGTSRVARSAPSRHCERSPFPLPARVVILSGRLCLQPGETCKEKRLAHVSLCTVFASHAKGLLRWLHEEEGELTVWSIFGCVIELLSGDHDHISGAISCFSGNVSSSAPVGVVGAAAGGVMNTFHTQTRIHPAHLVTAALTFCHSHPLEVALQLVSVLSS